MILEEDDKAAGIFFFDEKGLSSREMLFSEFDAILCGYVTAYEWAGQSAKAVYVEIDNKMNVTATLFFTVEFTETGAVASNWNIPINALIAKAACGPDMGSGPIRMVCQSFCPDKRYMQFLWEPDLSVSMTHLRELGRQVKKNKLALQFRASKKPQQRPSANNELSNDVTQALEEQMVLRIQSEFKQKLHRVETDLKKRYEAKVQKMMREQQQLLDRLNSTYDTKIEALKYDNEQALLEFKARLDANESILVEEKQASAILADRLDGQVKKNEGLRDYYEHKIKRLSGDKEQFQQELQTHIQKEFQLRLEEATSQYRELVHLKDLELQCLSEQERSLRGKLDKLASEMEKGNGTSGGRAEVLETLVSKGVTFVSYQPGAGHMTIPMSDMDAFVANPMAYAAARCGVEQSHYVAWMDHYQVPICCAKDEKGVTCGANLDRVDLPASFVEGESDRCTRHQKNRNLNLVKLAGT